MRAVVAGGGLAGLSCAIELLNRGAEVTVLEAAPYLGGKATSWRDPDGDQVETGLHVIPGRYRALLDLLERVGAAQNLRWCPPRYTWIDEEGRIGRLRLGRLPAPLHAMSALLRYEHLSFRQRVAAHLAYGSMVLAGQAGRGRLEETTVSDWMRSLRIDPSIVKYTMGPPSRALTFIDADDVSAKVMYDWVRHFLKNRQTSRMAVVDGGLGEQVIAPIAAYLTDRGGEVRLDARVEAIESDGSVVTGLRLTGGETVKADAYVSALPLHELRQALPRGAKEDPGFTDLWRLSTVPVISVQIWFDRKVTDSAEPMFRTEGPISILADVSNIWSELSAQVGSLIEMIVSPAGEVIDLPDEQIRDLVLDDLRSSLPPTRQARVVKHSVVKIPESIYAAYPGAARFRPGQRTSLANLALAGDFTQGELSPNMEAATQSGKAAAEVLLPGNVPSPPKSY